MTRSRGATALGAIAPFVVALCVGLAATGNAVAHAEPTKVSGKSGQVALIARTPIFLGGDLADTGQLESLSRVLTSADPDWNQAKVFSVRFSDPHARRERQMRGHMVVTHPGGDQTFLEYEFRWKALEGGATDLELRAHFVRGTGKFKGIRGSWRERGRSTVTEDASGWEVEYELP